MIFNPKFISYKTELNHIIKNFNSQGEYVVFAERNTIKKFTLSNGLLINIKSFKKPHIINKIAYKYFRKSKAKRSFEYATLLLQKGIGTPEPIAYKENFSFLGLNESYYISEQIPYDLTFRELVEIPDFPDHENILRQFTQFCFQLHEKQIEFKDHTPGNTLIQAKENGKYDFFLVDLNRMNFRELSFDDRMKNLCRLTPKKEMVEIMSDEYAKLYSQPKHIIYQKLWNYTDEFQKKYHKNQDRKNKYKSLFGLK